jgi:hypothetical protein
MAAITRFAARKDARSPFGPAIIRAECAYNWVMDVFR